MNKPIPFGKYYLLERINVGGMAEVFRAKAFGVEGFERLVAVKRILPNIAEDKEFIRMFIDEAKIAVQLNHANIAQIFDLGMVDAAYYIALEHVHGRDLRAIFDRCRQQGEPMPVAQACFVGMKVCEGLDYAHNKRDQAGRELNLVHRDVSPQNILVSFEGEVKLIDFGIAKAAGKGSKTQAGILKGKFGYMSPEQVRGLPIDRRSDVFSCGIVLYELLTGERLFVGESDFSTLEKVRNVEILPPSTYNRKIPDELERIVLRALAKDVDDRYQNAIDLHDELQAFVYTAGEFYSRKDLAGWMKQRFAREIEDETGKLEEFRKLKPPEARPAQTRRQETSSELPRRSTMAMPAMSERQATKPPPIPSRPPVGPMNGSPSAVDRSRRSGNFPAVSPGDSVPPGPRSSQRLAAAPPAGDLEWDEDELETAIYDDQPVRPPAGAGGPALAAENMVSDPDLVPIDWNSQSDLGPQAGPDQFADGSNKRRSPLGSQGMSPAGPPLNGSAPLGAPGPSPLGGPSIDDAATIAGRHPAGRDSSAVAQLVAIGERERRARESASSFGEGLLARQQPRRTGLIAGLGALAVLLIGGGVALYVLLHDDGSDTEVAAADTADTAGAGGAKVADTEDPKAPATSAAPEAQPPGKTVDPNTGFDLIVEPSNVKVKLDGRELSTRPPLQIRNLAAGEHTVEISAPPGFFNKTQKVLVEASKAPRVTIELDAMEITGNFRSQPSGAKVVLVSAGERSSLGRTPVTAKLNPRKHYEVMFKKDDYVTVTRPVDLGSGEEVEVEVKLERAHHVAANDHHRGNPVDEPDDVASITPPSGGDSGNDHPADSGSPAKVEKKPGFLAIGAKPPCRIFIDGRDTGLRTPKRGIELPAGKHRVTLVNNDHGIKESFSVRIRPGKTTRQIKDWSDRL